MLLYLTTFEKENYEINIDLKFFNSLQTNNTIFVNLVKCSSNFYVYEKSKWIK